MQKLKGFLYLLLGLFIVIICLGLGSCVGFVLAYFIIKGVWMKKKTEFIYNAVVNIISILIITYTDFKYSYLVPLPIFIFSLVLITSLGIVILLFVRLYTSQHSEDKDV